jgi:hypothetical protein
VLTLLVRACATELHSEFKSVVEKRRRSTAWQGDSLRHCAAEHVAPARRREWRIAIGNLAAGRGSALSASRRAAGHQASAGTRGIVGELANRVDVRRRSWAEPRSSAWKGKDYHLPGNRRRLTMFEGRGNVRLRSA